MPFYVRVGPRGVLFRIATLWTDVTASITCWWKARRRGSIHHCRPVRATRIRRRSL